MTERDAAVFVCVHACGGSATKRHRPGEVRAAISVPAGTRRFPAAEGMDAQQRKPVPVSG